MTTQELAISPITAPEQIPWTSWLLMPFLFVIIGQDMGQRCFAGKSPKIVSLATAAAALLLVICSLLPTYLGILGSTATADGDTSVLLQTVANFTNPTITSLFACAIFMAIISTADSLLCAISSNLALDFSATNPQTMRSDKAITFVVGITSMVLAYFEGDIIPIMILAYELSVSTLFIPIVMAVMLKSPSPKAAFASILAGLLSFTLFKVTQSDLPQALIGLVISTISFVTIQLYIASRQARSC